MEFDVFLSHNSKDKPAVRELKDLLTANKLGVWLDEDELQPGIPWQQLLEAGIKSSKSVAVLVGKDGLGPWEDEEMQAALVLAVKDKRPCIPVLLPGASATPALPMFLGNRTWVDLRAGFTEEGLGKLIWGITGKKPEQRARGPAQEGARGFSTQLKDSAVFYLFASPITAWDESGDTLFYKITGNSQAASLCRLFTREYGNVDSRIFHCSAAESFGLDEQVLFDEILDWLSTYDDPDPGVYDPRPSADLFARAQYSVRARTWEDLLQSLAKRHSSDSVEPQNRRPELYSHAAMMLPLEAGKPETVLVGLGNRGDETARNICLGGGNHVFTTQDFAGPLVYKHVAVQVRPDIGPHDKEENSLLSASDKPLTEEQIELLKDGKVLFFHFAEGEYNDDEGNTYPIDYCYMFNPKSPNVMSVCPEKYWPKNRTDRRGVPTLDAVQPSAIPKSEPPSAPTERPKAVSNGASSIGHPGSYDNMRWSDYTEDYFGGLIWRWQYRPEMGDQVARNIRGFCPEDNNMLRGFRGPAISDAAMRHITFSCPDHPHNAAEVTCSPYDDYKGIRIFIQTRLQNGTWRDVVKQQREARRHHT